MRATTFAITLSMVQSKIITIRVFVLLIKSQLTLDVVGIHHIMRSKSSR